MALGACYIPCGRASECPTDQLTCTTTLGQWPRNNCLVREADQRNAGCGPGGWRVDGVYGACFIKCSAEGAHDECPPQYQCTD